MNNNINSILFLIFIKMNICINNKNELYNIIIKMNITNNFELYSLLKE